ncbi:MAG: DUF5659 domain-containing protein [Candidatus Eisenbacteria bacterium]|nr:DUF5659 domain-containing protein [Candidatus Eisenbacteria bacterium]
MKISTHIESKETFYRTADLALAVALSLSFPMEAIERENPQNPRRAYFVFKKTPALDASVETYWKRALKVEPLAYFEHLRSIKARLYGEE